MHVSIGPEEWQFGNGCVTAMKTAETGRDPLRVGWVLPRLDSNCEW